MNRPSDFAARIGKSIEASISTKHALLREQQTFSEIARVCELLIAALKNGHVEQELFHE